MVTGELPTTNNDVFNSAGREYKESQANQGIEVFSSVEHMYEYGLTPDQVDQLFNTLADVTSEEGGLKGQPADPLLARLEQNLARLAIRINSSGQPELIGYQSFIPVFRREDIYALGYMMSRSVEKVTSFNDELIANGEIPSIYETATAYTHPEFRGKGLNTRLKKELNSHIEQINGGGEMILRVGTAWNVVSIGLNTRNNGMTAVSGLSAPYAAELLWHMPYIRQDQEGNTLHFGLKTPDSKSKEWMSEAELNELMIEVNTGNLDNQTRITNGGKAVLLVSDVEKLVKFDQALRDLVGDRSSLNYRSEQEVLSNQDITDCLHSLRTSNPDTFFSILKLYAPHMDTNHYAQFKKHLLRNGTLESLSRDYPEVIGLLTLLGGVKRYHAHLIASR